MTVCGWSQTELTLPPVPLDGDTEQRGEPYPEFPVTRDRPASRPIRLPATATLSESPPTDQAGPDRASPNQKGSVTLSEGADHFSAISSREEIFQPPLPLFHDSQDTVSNALAFSTEAETGNPVRRIPTFVEPSPRAHRVVRYEVPLGDEQLNQAFLERGIQGRLIEVVDEKQADSESISDRLSKFFSPMESWREAKKVRLVRYEVPAEDILFHAQLCELDGQILEPSMLRLPEVRFFQPKARVYLDLKRRNDGEFDLFNDGAILASLDVIELYFPMPLISERFAEVMGRHGQQTALGWRVGGTLGLGITTALNNGSSDNGSAPVSTLAAGIRYEFPLGRPSRELLDTGDMRLDQRTRVGMEFGLQGGISTRESLSDSTDIGLYFGVLVNTPWGS
jgi:hypothetical protein